LSIVFFIGPSGSVKSTIVKLLLRETQPNRARSGQRARVGGMRSWRIELPSLDRVRVQDFRLLPNRTAYENVVRP
jgi:cell division transport system ATP-binding protein